MFFSSFRLCAFLSICLLFPALWPVGHAQGISADRSKVRPVQTNTASVRSLSLSVNKSAIVEFPEDVGDVIIANPEIADVSARGTRRMAVMALARGESNIVFLNKAGRTLLTLEVGVGGRGVGELEDILDRHLPASNIRAENVNGTVLLSGRASNPVEMDQALRVASRYVEEGADVINMMTLDGKDQVLLKVNIVEMQRSVMKRLGITLSNLNNPLTTSNFQAGGSNTSGLTVNISAFDVGATLQAMEQSGLVRTLAEPNLTAISGESAQFLAGGEFPIPVAQDNNRTTVEFKPYGVGLGFTPVVLSEGRISLRVATEVSETTSQGAVQSGSISIPGLKVRRAETTVELPSGGSLMIAGLIQQRNSQVVAGVPLLKDIPVLGALFRSRDFLNEETEMVVIVTPYLITPASQGTLRTPDQGYLPSNDFQAVFFGKFNQVYSVGSGSFDLTRRASGPVGFIVE